MIERCELSHPTGSSRVTPSLPAPVVRALGRLRAALQARFGGRLRELVLYGSYARGQAHDESDVDALLSARTQSDTNLANIAWVVEAILPDKAIAIGSHITARSYQFSADIVAVSGDGRAFRRVRAVLDARYSPPRVVRYLDLTHLGWPLAPEILESLRAGG